MPPTPLPLRRYPRYCSRDLEEVSAQISREFRLMPTRVSHRSSQADVRINCLYLPRMHISYVQYGTAVEVSPLVPLERYRLVLPLAGQAVSKSGSEDMVCDPHTAALISPTTPSTTQSDADSRRIKLSIRRDAVVQRLAALLGEAPVKPLVFHRAVDLSCGPGRSLASFVSWSIEQFDRDDALTGNPLMLSQFEDWILTALLTQHPHSYSDALNGSASALPRDVKRAVDYVHANADQPITIEDLVTVSGVAGRTLYKHFRDFTGHSPMAYLRKVRFERVRAELQQADPSDSVTNLALNWGFRHCGRFAVEYRRIYGESPSQTAKKGRPR